jgi:hypothetical protein
MSACETIRCLGCGDVIGVYEPMVLVLDDEAHVTSGAAANRQIPAHARRFHAPCFGLLDGKLEQTLHCSPAREPAVFDGA